MAESSEPVIPLRLIRDCSRARTDVMLDFPEIGDTAYKGIIFLNHPFLLFRSRGGGSLT
jgi:hypothetical protein